MVCSFWPLQTTLGQTPGGATGVAVSSAEDQPGGVASPVDEASDSSPEALRVDFQSHGRRQSVVGTVRLQARDGGMILMDRSRRFWTIEPNQIVEQTPVATPPEMSGEELAAALRTELGPEFDTFSTAHYITAYNGTGTHARNVTALMETLHRSFFTYWGNARVDVSPPEYPLVALVFRDRSSYLEYASEDVGPQSENLIGYYHLDTNRMVTYDVPNFERNVATIIHEATHQLAYNCGLQNRLGDNPMWVSEGLAMYFEAPDRRQPGRWRSIGRVNAVNLARFWKYFPKRPAGSLQSLILDDGRFQSADTAMDAYGEAWALTYFLIRTRQREYLQYLEDLAAGETLRTATAAERKQAFEAAMGESVEEVDRQFIAYMRKVRMP